MGHDLGADRLLTLLFLIGGIILGVASLALLRTWLKTDPERIVGGTIGLLVGVVIGIILGREVAEIARRPEISSAVRGLAFLLCSLAGIQVGASTASWMWKRRQGGPEPHAISVILDTSVIIDGRIADVCETGFLQGDLIIPEFVLQELQSIADSSESTKRTRGRRGLDILNKIKKQSYIGIVIDETDYPSIKEVDQKLIQRAKETGYAILTNDFNLNKVAEVHSIQVLNMNALANALKPIVLPGETIRVQVIKEGKELGQGVAYLDDGTMVVIDGGRRLMGKSLDVTVTSVLQTTAGRMIFAAIKGG